MTSQNIAVYVSTFLNSIYNQKINITTKDKKYIINDSISFPIYDLVNKNQQELLDDFENNTFNGDIVTTIFFFLSGYWEHEFKFSVDQFGRYKMKDTFNYKKDIVTIPVVDMIVLDIKNQLNIEFKDHFKNPSLFLTHDIDVLCVDNMQEMINIAKRFIISIIKKIKKTSGDSKCEKNQDPGKTSNINFRKYIKKIYFIFFKKNLYSIENLLEISNEYNLKSNCFFLPRVQKSNMYGGYNLDKNKEKINKNKQMILDYKGDIGLHYDANHYFENRNKYDRENLQRVTNYTIRGGRAHYLVFDIQKSFDEYENSGMKLDSSCGYAESIGYRFGTSYPFFPYNFKTNKSYSFIEVPLIVMDGSMKDAKYMNLDSKIAKTEAISMMNNTIKLGGVFTLLWHNTSFEINDWNLWRPTYISMLQYAKDNGFISYTVSDFCEIYGVINDK